MDFAFCIPYIPALFYLITLTMVSQSFRVKINKLKNFSFYFVRKFTRKHHYEKIMWF